ncbi:MAG: C40 family peptidase [Deltaproteobacteria bacterium]|nr:C40 family peptidase [Deltaproteobacteria bacterium]
MDAGAAPRPIGALLAAAALLCACGGPQQVVRPSGPPRTPPPRELEGPLAPHAPTGLLAALPVPTRVALLATARGWLGRSGPFEARGRRFHADCSGYVEAVYEAQGIPIRDAFDIRPVDEWRASAALQRATRELGVLYGAEREPLAGDLVFFENTYDRNRNGKADDGVTHVGLVEEVRADGAVVFLHRGGRGVARAVLDLRAPSTGRAPGGAQRNSPLRARARDGEPALAGELFAGFGRIDPARVAAVLDGNARLDLAVLGFGEPAGGIAVPEGR